MNSSKVLLTASRPPADPLPRDGYVVSLQASPLHTPADEDSPDLSISGAEGLPMTASGSALLRTDKPVAEPKYLSCRARLAGCPL
jgi:hypothetical protein